MPTFQEKFDDKLQEYEKVYDLGSLNDANDKANLYTILRNQIIVEQLQDAINDLVEQDTVNNITEIKKLSDAVKDMVDRIVSLEKTLGIDRKTRRKDDETSVGDYLVHIKTAAREFMEQRIIKVYCPQCKVMVGRIAPVHDHTSYRCSFTCSQCKQEVIAHRKERDVFFDLKPADREWRRKYPAEIIQPDQVVAVDFSDEDPDLIIEDE